VGGCCPSNRVEKPSRTVGRCRLFRWRCFVPFSSCLFFPALAALARIDPTRQPNEFKWIIEEKLVLHRLVAILNKCDDNIEILRLTHSILKSFGSAADPVPLVESDVVGRVIQSLANHLDDPMIVSSAVAMLGNVSDNEHLKMLVRNQQVLFCLFFFLILLGLFCCFFRAFQPL
jgi:hypothetical protein